MRKIHKWEEHIIDLSLHNRKIMIALFQKAQELSKILCKNYLEASQNQEGNIINIKVHLRNLERGIRI